MIKFCGPISLSSDDKFSKKGVTLKQTALDHAPDWDTWLQIPKCELWEAVALSCDLEPDRLRLNGDFYPDFAYTPHSSEFKKRLKITCANLDELHDAFDCPIYVSTPYSMKVSVAGFGRWAESRGWTLPKEFPRKQPVVTDTDSEAAEVREELPTKRRNSYLLLVAALLKHAGIDPVSKGIAAAVNRLLEANGIPMDEKTIRSILAEIPEALESRQK